MTPLLVRLFVKNYKDTRNSKVRTSYGIMASMVGIACNVLLFGVKLTIGIVINSISVMADAVNNLSDAASSIISFFGVKMSEKPADREHPFGHGRFEYISALAVAFLILQVGFSLLQKSFDKILHPQELVFHPVLIGILMLSVLVKLWMYHFNKTLGESIHSNILKATSADSRNDVIVTTATILSVLIGKGTGTNIDGWVGLSVSLFVMFAGVKLVKDTLVPLLGEAVDREVYTAITSMVESYDGIIGSHDLIAHNYGPAHIMATIHAELPNDSNMEEAHETIDQIEKEVLRELGVFLVIHMDPVEVKNQEVLQEKENAIQIVSAIEPRATIHDFRVVNGKSCLNLCFDLVVPHSYNEKEEKNLLSMVMKRIGESDQKYQYEITIEKDYIAES